MLESSSIDLLKKEFVITDFDSFLKVRFDLGNAVDDCLTPLKNETLRNYFGNEVFHLPAGKLKVVVQFEKEDENA